MSPTGAEIGTVLGGRYRLTGLLGEGGMGRVFSAEHTVLGRKVAVKVLHPQFEINPEFAERFLREARAASAIEHPGIIDVLDADHDESGTLYMVMELLEGESLSALLARRGRLDPAESLELTRQILDALRCAHEQNVVHRDLKPDNIFLVAESAHGPRARLLDFGISRVIEPEGSDLRLTRTGTVMGTPYYMAPEQARGLKDADHRADIWAVGVILYQMLSGARPYDGDSYNAIMVAIAVETVPPLREVVVGISEAVVRFVDGALAKDPAERYETVAAMEQALARLAVDPGPGTMDDTLAAPALVVSDDAVTVPEPYAATMAAEVPTEPAMAAQPAVGGFWRRAAALVIDLIVFSLVIGAPVGALLPDSDLAEVKVTAAAADGKAKTKAKIPKVTASNLQASDEGLSIVGDDGDSVHIDDTGIHIVTADGEEVHVDDGNINIAPTLATKLKSSLWILYCTIFLALFGATPGKMVLGLRVVQKGQTGPRVPVLAALLRSAFFIISAFAAGLGCLWCLFDSQRRTWHDRIARTRVIHVQD